VLFHTLTLCYNNNKAFGNAIFLCCSSFSGLFGSPHLITLRNKLNMPRRNCNNDLINHICSYVCVHRTEEIQRVMLFYCPFIQFQSSWETVSYQITFFLTFLGILLGFCMCCVCVIFDFQPPYDFSTVIIFEILDWRMNTLCMKWKSNTEP